MIKKAILSIPTYHRAVLELIIAGAIWGSSFTFAKWALVDFSTSTLIFWRFLMAVLIGEGFMFFFQRKTYFKSHGDLWLSMFSGFSLGSALLFQTHGLNFITATNSSFITSLYVVMIPFFSYFFFKHSIYWYHFALSILAFVGMGFLLDLGLNGFKFSLGDALTLGAAVTSTFHIIAVSIGSKKMNNAFRFNTLQTFWALVLVIPFLVFETQASGKSFIPSEFHLKSVLSILSLSVFVSLGAFFLQIRSQKVLSTTTASMLCLLEAPYSFIFASVFLSEKLSPVQFFGAALIMLSSLISVYVDRPQNGNP